MRPVYIDDCEVQFYDAIECTGVAARWCPIHGDCTDVPDDHIPTAPYSDHCSDPDCPLHGARSTHATAPEGQR